MAQTVFVTGASGFIAKHIVRQLLSEGHHVVGTLRSPTREAEVRAAVRPSADGPDAATRLRFAALDLLRDEGWAEAMDGCGAVVHCASPYPFAEPRREAEVIAPAVDGTLRVLRAVKAAGLRRVVLTSSTFAVTKTPLPAGRDRYTEADWSDVDGPFVNAYAKSKTLAERAAWRFVQDEGATIGLTAINPGLVLGPPLDRHFGASVTILSMILRGKFPLLPRYGGPMVDVRDVARMHVRALERPATAGQRYLAAGGSHWVREMAEILKGEYPDRRIAVREGPNWLMRVLARLDRSLRSLKPDLGRFERVSTAAAARDLDMTFTPATEAIRATARFLIAEGLL